MKTLLSFIAMTVLSGALIASGGDSDKKLTINASESKVVWKGKKVTGEHHGTIKVKSGNLEIKNGVLSTAEVIVDMTSLVNKDIKDQESRTKLENHLRSDDFFSVDKHPESKFVITKVEKTGNGKFNVTGNLTIKGKTNPITFPAEIKKDGNKYVAKADLVFDRSKYDVRFGSKSFFNDLGDNLIYDDVELSVKLIAQ